MQIFTANHWPEVEHSYGRVRGKIEGAKGNSDPIGRTTVSTNPEPWKLPETKPPTKQHTHTHTHTRSRGLPCLPSVGEYMPNPVEACSPGKGDVKGLKWG